jgi:hypothetical protein
LVASIIVWTAGSSGWELLPSASPDMVPSEARP